MMTTLLAAALLLQEPAPSTTDGSATLRYGGDRATARAIENEMTLEIDVQGTEGAVNFIRSMSPFFSFSKINVKGSGERSIDRVDRKTQARTVRVEYAEARVDGVFDDEKFEFDFARRAPPEDLQEDKMKAILWAITMNGHPHTLSPAGAVKWADPGQDAFGEALGLLAWPIARLPDRPVKEGDAWDAAWRGERKDKQRDGYIKFTQKVRLDKLADGRATMAVEIAGTLDAPPDPNAEKQETKVEGKGKVTLDVKTGLIVASEAQGKIEAYYKGIDPGGNENELTVAFKVKSKLGSRE